MSDRYSCIQPSCVCLFLPADFQDPHPLSVTGRIVSCRIVRFFRLSAFLIVLPGTGDNNMQNADTTKYIIHTKISADGVIERPDIVGAIFGQTEGLLGTDLDLRELQKTGRIGRIEVMATTKAGKTRGNIFIPSSLDKVKTSVLAASLETIDRVGPCTATIEVTKVEDVRAVKRASIIERAKVIYTTLFDEDLLESQEIADVVRESVRIEGITFFGKNKIPAGPEYDSDNIIIVEGRADVLNLLKYGIKNTVSVGGTNIPPEVAELTKGKTVTVFTDGDRGGELIIRELMQVANVDFVARPPDGKAVEDLVQKEIVLSLRKKIPAAQYAEKCGIPAGRKLRHDDKGEKKSVAADLISRKVPKRVEKIRRDDLTRSSAKELYREPEVIFTDDDADTTSVRNDDADRLFTKKADREDLPEDSFVSVADDENEKEDFDDVRQDSREKIRAVAASGKPSGQPFPERPTAVGRVRTVRPSSDIRDISGNETRIPRRTIIRPASPIKNRTERQTDLRIGEYDDGYDGSGPDDIEEDLYAAPVRSGRPDRKNSDRFPRSDDRDAERSSRSDDRDFERSSRSDDRDAERSSRSDDRDAERSSRSDDRDAERSSRYVDRDPERSVRSGDGDPERSGQAEEGDSGIPEKAEPVLSEKDRRSAFFEEQIRDLSGSLCARLIGDDNSILKEVRIRDLASTLKEGAENIRAVIFDGVVTQRLIDIAGEQHIPDIVGLKEGSIVKRPAGLNITVIQ